MEFFAMTKKPARLLRPLLFVGYLTSFAALLLMSNLARANEVSLAINLGLAQKEAAEKYKPVVDYLAQATGERVKLKLNYNSFAHWEKMRRENYDVVIDNPAFTAFRTDRMDYTVIGKLPDVLSFTLVSHVDEMMFEPDELIGRNVASVPSPSISALRLEQVFSNPMRQPNYIPVDHYASALQLIMEGRAIGAMVPTGLLGSYNNLTSVYTTEQLPAPGVSVSSKVSPDLRNTIREAMLNAHQSEAGRTMLEALNVTQIEAANNDTYAGLEVLLEGLYGY
ncbi:MAG: PhnD/SsuA/transferrin family substrate-binding protein [Pseudomonadota bacterium]